MRVSPAFGHPGHQKRRQTTQNRAANPRWPSSVAVFFSQKLISGRLEEGGDRCTLIVTTASINTHARILVDAALSVAKESGTLARTQVR